MADNNNPVDWASEQAKKIIGGIVAVGKKSGKGMAKTMKNWDGATPAAPTKMANEPGLQGIPANFARGLAKPSRDLWNLIGDVTRFMQGKNPGAKNAGLGDTFVGSEPKLTAVGPAGQVTWPGRNRGTTTENPVAKGLYDDVIANLTSRMTRDPAMIQQIYKNLADQIAAGRADIGQQYDTAAQMLTNAANAGTTGTNAMYDAVRNAEIRQRQALGTQEAGGLQENLLGLQQQQAGNAIQQLLANEQARNAGYRQAAISSNAGAVIGAQQRGAAAAAQRAQALQDQINQLGIQNTQYANELEMNQAKAAADIAYKEAMAKARTKTDPIAAYQSLIDQGVNSDTAIKLATA